MHEFPAAAPLGYPAGADHDRRPVCSPARRARAVAGPLAAALSLAVALAAGCNRAATPGAGQPQAAGNADPAIRVPAVGDPTPAAPVSWGALVDPELNTQGEQARLVVRAKLAAGWHIYSASGPVGDSIATRLELVLPEGITAEGPWQEPASKMFRGALGQEQAVYEGDVLFVQPLAIGAAGAGEKELACRVTFQACTAESCLPPETIELTAKLTVE